MVALLTAVFLHAGLDTPLALAAMLIPFGGILGLGMWLIVPEITKAQSEPYQYRAHRPKAGSTGTNGHSRGNGTSNGATKPRAADQKVPDRKLRSN
jgi:hypothetical protein